MLLSHEGKPWNNSDVVVLWPGDQKFKSRKQSLHLQEEEASCTGSPFYDITESSMTYNLFITDDFMGS